MIIAVVATTLHDLRCPTHSSVAPFCVRLPQSGPRPIVGMSSAPSGSSISEPVCIGLIPGLKPQIISIDEVAALYQFVVDGDFSNQATPASHRIFGG